MKVSVNGNCIACGACESVCDAVFSIEDTAKVNEAAVAGNEDCVKEAADCCPVNAIELS
ncbi:ferredoxin [bacterium]|nr:ferredoxin [bacterium]